MSNKKSKLMQKMLEIIKQADDPSFSYTNIPKDLIPQIADREEPQELSGISDPQQIFNQVLSEIDIDAIMDELANLASN